MLRYDQFITKDGMYMTGYVIRNGINKVVAIGAAPCITYGGFLFMAAKRYQKDSSLVQAVEKLTGRKPEFRY